MIYAMVCFNSITARYRAEQFIKIHGGNVTKSNLGRAGKFLVVYKGDEYHFVPVCSIDRWAIGRWDYKLVLESGIEKYEREGIMDREAKEIYAKERRERDTFGMMFLTDAEVVVAQARKIDNLKKLADKANEEIKKLNEENKALIEEVTKLKKGNKELLDACEGFDKLCEIAKGVITVEKSALPIIEYQGMKFKATRLVIDENCMTRRTMHIDATMVSE